MGDYKLRETEAVERDRSRAVDEAAAWVSRSEHERAVSAAVEERDRQNDELRNEAKLLLWWIEEAAILKGAKLTRAEIAAITRHSDALRSLLSPVPEIPGLEGTRGAVDGLLVEGRQEPPAVTTSEGGKSNG